MAYSKLRGFVEAHRPANQRRQRSILNNASRLKRAQLKAHVAALKTPEEFEAKLQQVRTEHREAARKMWLPWITFDMPDAKVN